MPPKWSWTEQKRRAARLLAEGCHKQTEIATKLGIARETLRLWKEHEEFKTEIDNQIQLLEQDRKHEREQQEKTKADCQSLLDRVTSVVEQITSEQLEAINKNPIAAINLWLRLHNAVNTTQKRNTANTDDDDAPPNLAELEPEVVQRIMAVLAREHARGNAPDGETTAQLLPISATHDQLQAPS